MKTIMREIKNISCPQLETQPNRSRYPTHSVSKTSKVPSVPIDTTAMIAWTGHKKAVPAMMAHEAVATIIKEALAGPLPRARRISPLVPPVSLRAFAC